MKKYIPVIPTADPFEWKLNPTWWDYKAVFEDDIPPAGYEKRAIFLYYDSSYTISMHDVAGSQENVYIRLSDGWEGLWKNMGNTYHVWDTKYDKPCDLGYKTRYAIIYTPAGQRDINLGSLSCCDNSNILLAYIDDAEITSLSCGNSTIEAFITTNKTTVSTTKNWSSGGLSNNYKLQYVKLPKGLKSLPNYFLQRTSIREIELPEGIEEIYSGCFYECFKLEKISLPESLTKIGEYAFQYCFSLKSFKAPLNLKYIDRYAFYYCPALTNIELNEGLEYIGYDTFSYCPFSHIKLPSSLKYISYFYHCWNLKEIILPESLEEIESGVADGLTPVERLKVPNSLKKFTGNIIGNDYCLKRLIIDKGFVPPYNYFNIPSRLSIPSLCEDFLKNLGDNTKNETVSLSLNRSEYRDAIMAYDPTIIPTLQAKNYSI